MYYLKFIVTYGLLTLYLVKSDTKCNTDGPIIDDSGAAKFVFKNILSGNNSIDPMSIDDVHVKIKDYQVDITNIKFTNFNTCSSSETLNLEKKTYNRILKCSELIFTADVAIKGELGMTYLDRKDTIIITSHDYVINTFGHFDLFTPEGEKSERVYLNGVIQSNSQPKGRIKFKTNDNFGLTKMQDMLAMSTAVKHKALIEQKITNPIKDEMASKIMNAIAAYLRSVPVEELRKHNNNNKDCAT